MDIADIERLVRLMKENDLVELEIEREGSTVRLKKSAPITALAVQAPPPMLHASGFSAAPAAPPSAAAPATTLAPGTIEIRSPIVGTFYRSASPEAAPFVNVGDRVHAETVVCIVEAMKVMNEIKAEVAGEIIEVLVENGEAVEFDQPLFRVKSA